MHLATRFPQFLVLAAVVIALGGCSGGGGGDSGSAGGGGGGGAGGGGGGTLTAIWAVEAPEFHNAVKDATVTIDGGATLLFTSSVTPPSTVSVGFKVDGGDLPLHATAAVAQAIDNMGHTLPNQYTATFTGHPLFIPSAAGTYQITVQFDTANLVQNSSAIGSSKSTVVTLTVAPSASG